jgi:predicted PurR-regulated permease PerM
MKNDDPSKILPLNKTIQAIVFGAILLLLFVFVWQVFRPFVTVLLWSTLFYILFSPLHRRLSRRIKSDKLGGAVLRNLLAAAFALLTALLVLIPVSFVLFQLIRQVMELLHTIRNVFYTKPEILEDLFGTFSAFIADITSGQITISPSEIQRQIVNALSLSLQNVVQVSSGITRNVWDFLLGMVFLVFCLFFFYLDGAYLSRLVLHAIPIRKDYISTLVKKFQDITRNLFLGYIAVAFIQAVLAYIVFSLFKVNGSLVFACLTFICVFVPMIGGGLVWLPLGIARILSGNIVGGIVFLLVAGTVISLLDNFLRPLFLRNRIKLHPLIIFFSILGGLTAFGFNGLILGPTVVILFLTVLDMFLSEHEMLNDAVPVSETNKKDGTP